MAISRKALGTDPGTSISSTLVLAYPSGWSAGDFAIAIVELDNSAVTIPAGWTEIADFGVGPAGTDIDATKLVVISRFLEAGDSGSITITSFTGATSRHIRGRITTYTGVDSADPFTASSPKSQATASTTLSTNSITSAENDNNCLFLAIYGTDLDGGTPTVGSSAFSGISATSTLAYAIGTGSNGGGGSALVEGAPSAASTGPVSHSGTNASTIWNSILVRLNPTGWGASPSISPDSAVSGHAASSPTVAANSSIVPGNSAHAHTASEPTVTVAISVEPDNAVHAQTASEPTIAAASSVSVDDAAHDHAASGPSLSAQSSVQPDDAEQDHTASEPSLSVSSTVAPDDAHHDSSGSSPTISSGGEVQPDDAAHDHEASSPTLSGALAITPVSAAHAHIAGQPTIAWRSMIAANDAAHETTASSPNIAARSLIAPASAAHSHSATISMLSAFASVSVNSAYHYHRASSPANRISLPPSTARTIVARSFDRTILTAAGPRTIKSVVSGR